MNFTTKEKLLGKTLVLRFGPKLKLSFQIVLFRIKLHQTVSVGKEHILFLFSFYLTKMEFPLIFSGPQTSITLTFKA